MKKITDIKPAVKSSRFNIFIDGEFAFSLSAKGIFETGISVGKTFDDREFEDVLRYVEDEKVFSSAVKFLGYRDYSEKELVARLAQNGMEGTEAVAKLVRMGYVDDEKYARSVIEKMLPKYGKNRISEELRKRGISREVYEPMLDELCGVQRSGCYAALVKKQKMKPFEDRAEKNKVYAFLLRRGFGSEDIADAMRQYESSVGDNLSDD